MWLLLCTIFRSYGLMKDSPTLSSSRNFIHISESIYANIAFASKSLVVAMLWGRLVKAYRACGELRNFADTRKPGRLVG